MRHNMVKGVDMRLDRSLLTNDLDILLNHLGPFSPDGWSLLSPGIQQRSVYLPNLQIVLERAPNEAHIKHIHFLHENKHQKDFLAFWDLFNLRVNIYVRNFKFLTNSSYQKHTVFSETEKRWLSGLNEIFEALALWELEESTEYLKANEAKPYKKWLIKAAKQAGYTFLSVLRQFAYTLRHYALTRGAGLDVIINGYLATHSPVLSQISNEVTTYIPEIQLAQPPDLQRLLDISNYFFPRISDYPQNVMMVMTSLDEFEIKVLECSKNYYDKWEEYLSCYKTIVDKMREVASHSGQNIPADLLCNPINLMDRQLSIMQKIYDWNSKVDNISESEPLDKSVESEIRDEAESIEKIARAVPIIGTDGSLSFSISDLTYLTQLLVHAAITHIREWKEKVSDENYKSLRCPFHGYVFSLLSQR